MSTRGHKQLEHTADISLEVWAESQEGLLDEAARALTLILTDAEPVRGTTTHRVELEALDAEDRLVAWLNEVLALALIDGLLYDRAEITFDGPDLAADFKGLPDASSKVRTELKMVTHHDLWLGQDAQSRWTCRFVVDV